jgi:tRNA-dihydrouridine synthase A
MMDCTDRHDRYFLRQISRHALLYTEMLTADAVIHGDRERLLGFDAAEHPVALQLGGAEPAKMAEAARIGADWGYDEININVGCPSDRVQSGRFGACLMAEPDTVAACLAAMRAAVEVPVTVKCRLGIDDRDDYGFLRAFAERMAAAGCETLIVHARKAILSGLSPKQNREVPPLHYDRVYRLKRELPDLQVIINGGIASLDEAEAHLAQVDGVMLGRAAYHDPYLLAEVDRRLFADVHPVASRRDVALAMLPYIEAQRHAGVRLNAITRHMMGLFLGQPGARAWRRYLSENACRADAGEEVVRDALALTRDDAARRSA